MFTLKKLLGSGKSSQPAGPVSSLDSPETGPVKMTLEERMAFRRDLLYEAIKVTMQAHGVLSASYKIKVVRADKRGHQYAVMMDLSTDFLRDEKGQPAYLAELGHAITKNAAARYGIGVAGVYWQVNAQIQGFEVSRPDPARRAAGTSAALSATQRYEHASAAELAAFEAAWQDGQELQLGNRVYASDLAPLGDDAGSGKRP